MEGLSSVAQFIVEFRSTLSALFSFPGSSLIVTLIMLLCVTLVAIAGYYISIWLLRVVARIVEKTETDWDDDLINAPILKSLSLLTPALIVASLYPYCFVKMGTFSSIVLLLTQFYIIWVAVGAANTFLDNLFTAFSKRKAFQPYAVRGIFQMGKLIFIAIGVIIGISLIVERSPVAILTALGASAAVLMLVFRDTILGLVAGVQLTANKMLHRGDWVVVPKHNANGIVLDITLTTVKIRNWDNSISTVPPYSLVSESFQNYQAMKRSGARRVCRAIYVDFNSIRHLSLEEIKVLKETGYVSDAARTSGDLSPRVNLTLFRNYLESWISCHPEVRNDLMYMVRQLEPTVSGLPLELYFFLSETDWKAFEHLQSDIFDHVYAVAPLFGLIIFQSPSGLDVMSRVKNNLLPDSNKPLEATSIG